MGRTVRDALLLPFHVVLFVWRVLWSRAMPVKVRLLLVGYLAYLLMPFDLIPDFLVVAGQLDDLMGFLILLQVILNSGEASAALWPGSPSSFGWLRRLLTAAVGWLPFLRPAGGGIPQKRTR
jgi:uncharacterized membrane protein YkvA (DUF1232 family)